MEKKAKQEKPWVRSTEARLYGYPVLRAMLIDLKAQNRYFYPLGATAYDGVGIHGKGMTSNPAFNNTLKKEALVARRDDKFEKYLREAGLIEELIGICSLQEKEFLEMRYFKNYAIMTIMHQLSVSRSVCYKVRDDVVARGAVIFGYLEYDEYTKMLA